MIKLNKIIFLTFLFFCFIFQAQALDFDLKSNNAIIYNLKTGEVLYEKNSEEKVRIASLTKIMTTIVAIEQIDNLEDKVIITYEMLEGLIEKNASVVGFQVGNIVTYNDLLHGTLIPSGADATRALAISLVGSEDEFVKLMNDKAISLGMNNTHYTNTSGLDTDNQYSTVKDVSIGLMYALNNPIFKEIYTKDEYTTTNGIKMKSTLNYYSNRYNIKTDYIIGAKTGYTDLAGYCLSTLANYNEIDYLTVTTGADAKLDFPNNIIDTNKMLKYFSENYQYIKVVKKNDILVTLKNKYSDNNVNIIAKEDIYGYMLKKEINTISYNYEGKEKISIFTDSKTKIGTVTIKIGDKLFNNLDIYKPEKVEFNLLKFLTN